MTMADIDQLSRIIGALEHAAAEANRQQERIFDLLGEVKDGVSELRADFTTHAEKEEVTVHALIAAGLADPDAQDDIREMRGLLDAWRSVKRGAGHAVGKIATVVILAAIAGVLGFNGGKFIEWGK